MDKSLYFSRAREIMGDNFIGTDELERMKSLDLLIPSDVPDIPFAVEELETKKSDYFLILGINRFTDGSLVNIKKMISIYGKNPSESEPCFYNQDWYNQEEFIETSMEEGWYLIRKNVYANSRAIQPNELMEKYTFPSAVRCVYSFFVAWEAKNIKLWLHDFVWCSDVDHNGDRIYVGKYHDVDGVNKNGFSIHRHLSLRPCYGCVD